MAVAKIHSIKTTLKKVVRVFNSMEELEHLKANINDYLGRNKVEKKESVIGATKKHLKKRIRY